MTRPLHNSGDVSKDERYTPLELIGRVRRALGRITLDPCAPVEPHEWAERQFDKTDNGLKKDWSGYVYVNPPGHSIRRFADHFAREWKARRIRKGCFLHFNWDHTTVAWETLHELCPTYALLCDRWKFEGPDGRLYEVGRSHGFAFVGVKPERVENVWKDIAWVMRGRLKERA